MFPSQAALHCAKEKAISYQEKHFNSQIAPIIEVLDSAIALFESYYKLFHSIRWNRERVAVKKETEAKLEAIALAILVEINKAGNMLNNYSQNNLVIDILAWNKIIVCTIEAKDWLKTNLIQKDLNLAEPIQQIEQLNLF